MSDGTIVAAETYIDADREAIFGESGWQETWTDDMGALYRSAQREFGRCIGHVYQEFSGKPYAVGWVFQGRDVYEDRRSGLRPGKGPDTYLREVWLKVGVQREDGVFAFDVKRRRPVPLPTAEA